MQYKIVSATQSAVTTTMTWTGASVGEHAFAGFKAAAAGTSAPPTRMLSGVGMLMLDLFHFPLFKARP